MKRITVLLLAAAVIFGCVHSVAENADHLRGDITGDGRVDSDDAVYLLRHTLFADLYPVYSFADFTGDGEITSDDAVYLLRHTLFPESYPIESSVPETSGTEETADHPVLRGGFMQPGTFAGYSKERMIRHLSYMREVGMDILILQWSFVTENGKVKQAFYEQSFPAGQIASGADFSAAGFVDVLLSAAEQTGMKIFIGLNDSSEWWQKGVNDRSWIETQAALGVAGAGQLYEKYARKYPDAFYGWYFVFEFYNQNFNAQQIENAAYLLNLYRNGLYDTAPDMPMMLSPFLSASGADPDRTETVWKSIFAKTDFREGDIYCCQDSVGAGHIGIDSLDCYFSALRAAVDTKPGLAFWANNEDFTQSDWTTAPLTRFVRQLEISHPYVENHVTFAYSHYQNPDTGKTGYHAAYKAYYETGSIPECTLSAPDVEYERTADGSAVEIRGTAADPAHTLMGVRITKNGETVKFFDYSKKYGEDPFSFSCTYQNTESDVSAVFEVCGVDYCGNEGPAYTFGVEFKGRSGRNAAAGKSYTFAIRPDSRYPDESGQALTDGAFGRPIYHDNAWVGFLGKPEMTVDLKTTETAVYAVEISTLGGGNAGVYAPTGFTVSVSDDGVSFRTIASVQFERDPGSGSGTLVSRVIGFENDVSARYVKIAVTTNQSWIFIDEIKIFAD